MKKLILLILGLTLAATLFAADAATLVPAGNRNAEQPDIPGASSRRTQATNTTFQAKYRKVYALLQNDADLRAKIKKAASAYGIDPMHIVGAIVGEHTSMSTPTTGCRPTMSRRSPTSPASCPSPMTARTSPISCSGRNSGNAPECRTATICGNAASRCGTAPFAARPL